MSEFNKFGFNFGSIKITKTCINEGVAIVSVKTPKDRFSIRATKTGFIRLFDEQGEELKLVKKEYLDILQKRLT